MADRLINTQGSNAPGRAQFEAALREIILARQKAETYQAHLRNAFKRADAMGFDTKQIKEVLKMRDRDPVELEAEMKVRAQYAQWAGVPVGSQLEMFSADQTGEAQAAQEADGLTDEERHAKDMFEAEQRGYYAGKRGDKLPDANPFKAGEEAFVEFERGYWRGQEAIALEMAPKDAPKRRGRPPKKAKDGATAEDGPPKDEAPAGEPAPETVH